MGEEQEAWGSQSPNGGDWVLHVYPSRPGGLREAVWWGCGDQDLVMWPRARSSPALSLTLLICRMRVFWGVSQNQWDLPSAPVTWRPPATGTGFPLLLPAWRGRATWCVTWWVLARGPGTQDSPLSALSSSTISPGAQGCGGRGQSWSAPAVASSEERMLCRVREDSLESPHSLPVACCHPRLLISSSSRLGRNQGHVLGSLPASLFPQLCPGSIAPKLKAS